MLRFYRARGSWHVADILASTVVLSAPAGFGCIKCNVALEVCEDEHLTTDMLTLLVIGSGLWLCCRILRAHLRKGDIPNAFPLAHLAPFAYWWAVWKRTEVRTIHHGHYPPGSGACRNVVRVAPGFYSFCRLPDVQKIYDHSKDTDVYKTRFYENVFSHPGLAHTAFEMRDARDAERRKKQTGHFLRLTGESIKRLEHRTHDTCQQLSSILTIAADSGTPADLYDVLGSTFVKLCLDFMLYPKFAPSLLIEQDKGKSWMAEIEAGYNALPWSQLRLWSSTGQRWGSEIDKWCYERCSEALKEEAPHPRIVHSLLQNCIESDDMQRREVEYDKIAAIAAAEVADDAVAGHLCCLSTAQTLYRLADNPIWQERVRDEIRRIVSERQIQDCYLQKETLEKFQILFAVLWETFRMSPPVSGLQPRTICSKNSGFLINHLIEPGSVIGSQAYTVNRDPTVFENPDKWDPSRWIGIKPDIKRRMEKSMFTFSRGRRGCAGQKLAEYLCSAVVAHIITQYKLSCTEQNSSNGMKTCGGFIAHACRTSDSQHSLLRLDRLV